MPRKPNKVFQPGRLKARRETKGLTQRDLADLIKVTGKQISGWETGRAIPESRNILRLSEALETTSAYLFNQTDDPEPTQLGVDRLNSQEQMLIEAFRRGDLPTALELFADRFRELTNIQKRGESGAEQK